MSLQVLLSSQGKTKGSQRSIQVIDVCFLIAHQLHYVDGVLRCLENLEYVAHMCSLDSVVILQFCWW